MNFVPFYAENVNFESVTTENCDFRLTSYTGYQLRA